MSFFIVTNGRRYPLAAQTEHAAKLEAAGSMMGGIVHLHESGPKSTRLVGTLIGGEWSSPVAQHAVPAYLPIGERS